MGGVIVPESTSEKWFTKFIDYSDFYGSAQEGRLLYHDRASKQLLTERIPVYSRIGSRLLYEQAGARTTQEINSVKHLLQSISKEYGVKFNSPSSKKYIGPFVILNRIDLEDSALKIEEFTSFNEFFGRKFKPGARKLDSLKEEVAVSPTDSKALCFDTVNSSRELYIKGTKFTIENLLQDGEIAPKFIDGSIMVCRLSPKDYHRFHAPVSGKIVGIKQIHGTLHSTMPMAVRFSQLISSKVDVYVENARTIIYIESSHFGLVGLVVIGSLLLGSIELSHRSGNIKRMDDLGHFQFGGSTVLLLFERGKIEFDKDLIENSQNRIETLILVGNSIGKCK